MGARARRGHHPIRTVREAPHPCSLIDLEHGRAWESRKSGSLGIERVKLFGQSRLSNSIPSTIHDSNERCRPQLRPRPRPRPRPRLDARGSHRSFLASFPSTSFHPHPAAYKTPNRRQIITPRFASLLSSPTNSSPIPRFPDSPSRRRETTDSTPLWWQYGDPLVVAQTLFLERAS